MPTISSSSMARWVAACLSIFRCSSSVSVSWRPIVSTGLSEVIGSWKIMPILLPRMWRTSSSSIFRMSSPSNMISPPTILPGGFGIRRRIESALTRLAAAALAHQAEDLARLHVVADAVDGLDHAVLCEELRPQVFYLQEWFGQELLLEQRIWFWCDVRESVVIWWAALVMVGKRGLEPRRPRARDPKSRSSTNSDTSPLGGPPRTRTWNPLIKSQLLCQLS